MTTEKEITNMDEELEIKDPKAVLDALERAKNDAKKYRVDLEAIQQEIAQLQTLSDTQQATIKSFEDGRDEWKARTKELMIKGALDSNSADRVMKFLDLESIDFDQDGKLTGLDDAVAKVKADLPELFDSKRRVGGEANLFEKGEVKVKPTGTEMQLAKIFHKD